MTEVKKSADENLGEFKTEHPRNEMSPEITSVEGKGELVVSGSTEKGSVVLGPVSLLEKIETSIQESSDKVEEVLNEEIQTVTIEGKEYPLDTNFVAINGDITPEIKEILLDLPKLEFLQADKAKNIPKELVNLKFLKADSAESIPKELVNLERLTASNAMEIPKELVHLRHLWVERVTEIPKELVNVTKLCAPNVKNVPKELVHLQELIFGGKKEDMPTELLDLTDLTFDGNEEDINDDKFPRLRFLNGAPRSKFLKR